MKNLILPKIKNLTINEWILLLFPLCQVIGSFLVNFVLILASIIFIYQSIKKKLFKKLKLKSKDFRLCVEIPIKSKIKKLRYATMASFERKRFAGKKNVNELIDGYFILSYLLKSFIKIKNE